MTGPLTGIIGDAVPTGWLFDGSATTLSDVRAAIGADTMWHRGYTGKGIGVALVDTGLVPVTGLKSGNVVNGPDLSFESQTAKYRYLDTFGHGTHMAGIIAGRDSAGAGTTDQFRGVAPDVKLTSVKTATSDGAVDVSTGGCGRRLGGRAPQRRQGQPDPGAQPVLRQTARRTTESTAGPRGGERVARRDVVVVAGGDQAPAPSSTTPPTTRG